MPQIVPETAANKDWPRRVAQAVNRGLNTMSSLVARVVILEAHTATVFTFTPTTTPSSPVAGMTYFDSGTNKLRCWDGTIWRDLW